MLLILSPQTTFLQLARAIEPTDLELVNVQACTFPSRPEPKRAQWSGPRGLVLAYVYEPDLELRYLWQCGQWPKQISDSMDVFIRPHEALFDTWETLLEQLHSASYPHVVRAVSAWRIRVLRGDNGEQQNGALHTLVNCLQQSSDIHTRRLIAKQLELCADQDVLTTLEDIAQDEPDIEVRLHLHQTIQMLHARQLF